MPFSGGKYTGPDNICDWIIGIGAVSGFYTLADLSEQALVPGNSVLLIRDTGLGDVLCLTPLIRILSRMGLFVDLQTWEKHVNVFSNNPHLRNVSAIGQPDVADDYAIRVDLRQVVENAEAFGRLEHRMRGFAHHMDIVVTDEDMYTDYFPKHEEIVVAKSQFTKTVLPKIAYIWSASNNTRSWSADYNMRMVNRLASEGYTVAVISEQTLKIPELPNIYNFGGLHTIRQSAAILAVCDVCLTPDTGMFHLAGALDVPTVAYFSSHPVIERQAHKHLTVLDNRDVCALFPCRRYDCMHHAKTDISPCIVLPPEKVIAAIKEIRQ